jgi:hypothetical protein
MAIQTITYQDKVALNQNPDIADINKCNASDLNEIKNVVNNNATETSTNSTNIANIINAEVYSTTEVKTNNVWINGKPIYRKVIQYTSALSGGNNSIPHGISNFDELVSLSGYTKYSTSYYLMGAYESANNFINASIVSSTTISVRVGTGWGGSFTNGCTFIIEYTKTTD